MSTMDQTILSTDFMHTDREDLVEQFKTTCEEWINDDLTKDQMLAVYKAAQSKLCHQHFPPKGSSGCSMGSHLIEVVEDMVKHLLYEEKATPTDFQETHLEFILALVKAGPLSSHIEFIVDLYDTGYLEFQDFFHSIRGEPLRKIVHVLEKEYRWDTSVSQKSFFSNNLDTFIRAFLNAFSEDQYKEMQPEFVDVYLYLKTSFAHKDAIINEGMYNLADRIQREFERNIFTGVKDAALLNQYIETLRSFITTPDFPQSDDVGKSIKSDLEDILKVINEERLIGQTYSSIMDLALDLTIKKAGCEGTRVHFEEIGYFFRNYDEEGFGDKVMLFEGLGHKFSHFLQNVKDELYLKYRFVKPVMCSCLVNVMGTLEKHIHLWIEMIKLLLKHSVPVCIDTAYDALREKEEVLKLKKYPEDIKEIFKILGNIRFPSWLTQKELKSGMDTLEKLIDFFLGKLKKVGISKLNLTESLLNMIFQYIEMRTEEAYSVAEALIKCVEFNPKQEKQLMVDTIHRVTTVLEDESIDWESNLARDLSSCLGDLVSHIFDSVKDGKMFTWDEYDDFMYLCKLCEGKLHSISEPIQCAFFTIYTEVSVKIIQWLQTMNEGHRLIPLIPGIINLLESDDEHVQTIATTLLRLLSLSGSANGIMLAHFMDKMVSAFLERDQHEVLSAITNSYEFNTRPVEERFDELFDLVDSGNSEIKMYIIQLVAKVAKHQPHLFTKERIEVLLREAKEGTNEQVMILMALDDVAKQNIEPFEDHIDDLTNPDVWIPMSAYHRCVILQLYALQSEEKAEKIINYLMKRVQTSDDHTEVLVSFNALRLIGFKYRPAIEKHRNTIEKLRESTGNNDYHTSCTFILDMLDGKSVDKIANELKELQGDVIELEVRVTATEDDIVGIKDTVQQHGNDLENVKNDLTEQGQHLEEVKGTVANTAAKIQAIDSKTLSHAPYWASDVAKLLNPEVDADWRLLALRLGFTNDDIKAWAQHADPCMIMLDEWYATHKTREATHAVLTSLQLLDREDAAIIVENAMKNAEDLVEDVEFEYTTPPDIFLSYQWGHQDEVRLLRQHLEMAGFTCWMDVGQMGGGDKLFEKIDTGIRGAKVVISCVSGKYAKSPNCNREVNLSVNLNKPIIPLLMEKLSWPPPGSMGPIFSEYLFIRFFQRGGEETKDQRYWPLPKFQELLMQLAMLGIKPDEQVIQPEYKDWWMPKVEELTIDKDRAKTDSSNNCAAAPSDNKQAAESPAVFISYQWGKQPQIQKLYKTLTAHGYSCWLDIMQMGGGDSLYDKIDSGLRGCQVVLSCITTKYSKSANCRREVSLADALQKPLIPLLLENLAWPPPGPMSPILTQLLYIDCTKDNMEETWTGPKFEELISMIDRHIPDHRPATQIQQPTQPEQQAQQPTSEQKEAAPPPLSLATDPPKALSPHPEPAPEEQQTTPSSPVAQPPREDAERTNQSLDSKPSSPQAHVGQQGRSNADNKPASPQGAHDTKNSEGQAMNNQKLEPVQSSCCVIA